MCATCTGSKRVPHPLVVLQSVTANQRVQAVQECKWLALFNRSLEAQLNADLRAHLNNRGLRYA